MKTERFLAVPLAAILVIANLALYKFAPCWTFDGWDEPTTFYRIWPLIIPAAIVLAIVSMRVGEEYKVRLVIGALWAILFAITVYGWYDGFWITFQSFRGTDAPWPEYC